MRGPAALALALGLILASTACSPEPTPGTKTTSPSGTPDQEAGLPAPGTPGQPAPVPPTLAPLEWTEVADPVETTVTAGSEHTLTVDSDGRRAVLEGPQARTIEPPPGFQVSDTLLDRDWAVVVAQDTGETRPSVATVVDLASGRVTRLDGRSEPATVNGGSWALGQGRLFHPTIGPRRAYCLAEVDLATGAAQTTYCAEPRTGFNQVRITPEGLSLLSFDSGTPSCRTVVSVGEATLEPFPGAADCSAWEGLLLPDGAVWTEVPDENRVELGQVRARVGEGYYDLGSSLTGSLTWCAGAAYFARNQETETGPAELLRWDGRALTVVLEAGEGGASSISAPRCGGESISVSVLAETGDQQLTARVG